MPIARDEDDAIVNAIAEKTNLHRVGCTRHLRANIKKTWWTHMKAQNMIDKVMDLVKLENDNEFQKAYRKRQKKRTSKNTSGGQFYPEFLHLYSGKQKSCST